MTSVKESAYAKINLYLDVVSKRADGFHDIKTVMHTVSLCDEISVSISPSKSTSVRLIISGEGRLPADSRNLAYKAAELFMQSTLNTAEVVVTLKKKIPISAGLAGGSSDAAAVLRALNRIYKHQLSDKRLLELASELGSDVPYCVVGGTALCQGRGEKITRLADNLSLHTVIAISGDRVSTPGAYKLLDEIYDDFSSSHMGDSELLLEDILSAVNSKKNNCSKLYNIFENAVFKTCSEAETIKCELLRIGASHAMMSGSGPSVFGIFESKLDAERARDILISKGYKAYYAHSIVRGEK